MQNRGIIRTYHNERHCNGLKINCCKSKKRGKYLKEEYFQNNGIKEGIYKKYYDMGNLQLECNYINDKLNGNCKKYNYYGILLIECNYIDDKLHGIYRTYYDNGKIKSEINYTSDKKNKIQKEYNIDGDLELEILL
jgi:antitoxin component YwqK of YwqJK toxin-antitoxin module